MNEGFEQVLHKRRSIVVRKHAKMLGARTLIRERKKSNISHPSSCQRSNIKVCQYKQGMGEAGRLSYCCSEYE